MLQLTLFGSFRSSLHNQDIPFRTAKIRALIAYIALETGENINSHAALPRDHLATLLWGENDDKTAKQNLRMSLYRLRKSIDKVGGKTFSDQLFNTNNQAVGINPAAENQLRCDAVEFVKLIQACDDHAHEDIHYCADCLKRLRTAADLYTGDLLAGMLLDDAPAFEEWLILTREQLLQQAQLALDIIIESYQIQGRYEQVREYGQRLLKLEPWRESTHRHIMLALAASGLRAAALTQYEKCKAVLWEELGAEPGPETVALAEKIESGAALNEFVDVTRVVGETKTSRPDIPNNLPSQMTPYFGRQAEIRKIVRFIDDPNRRLITLVGEGGIGKSRLSLEVGRQLQEGFKDGVWFIPLVMLPPSDEQDAAENRIATLVCETLSLPLSGKTTPSEQFINQFKNRNALLIFDNFEHVIEGADLLIRLLEAAPGVTILATSREPLGFLAESILRIRPLPIPKKGAQAADVSNPAVALFIDRAERVTGDFDIAEEGHLDQVVALCQFVGGLPLALELAAAGLRMQSLDELSESIHASYDAITARMRDIPKRHRSMRAVSESSWGLLSPLEQEVFAKCAVFRGGFWAEAGLAVADGSAELFDQLVEKSLLQVGENGRYGQHELLRQFAAEKLVKIGKQETLTAHSRYFLSFVADRQKPLNGPRPQVPAAEMTQDLDNIRLGWNTAVDNLDQEILLHAIESLSTFFEMRGYYREANDRFSHAEHLLKNDINTNDILLLILKVHVIRPMVRLAKFEEAQSQIDLLLQIPQVAEIPAFNGTLYLYGGEIAWRTGTYHQALDYFERVIEIGNSNNLPHLVSSAHYQMGTTYFYLGRSKEAVEFLSNAKESWRSLKNYRMLAQALNNQGVVHYKNFDYQKASAVLNEALIMNEGINDAHANINILNNLSLIASDQKRFKESQKYLYEVLELAERFGDQHAEALAYYNLGYNA
ncbi:MAG: BTAD domain-containing putative transcriptional regulator, partial [Chloroflexota bacterium]